MANAALYVGTKKNALVDPDALQDQRTIASKRGVALRSKDLARGAVIVLVDCP